MSMQAHKYEVGQIVYLRKNKKAEPYDYTEVGEYLILVVNAPDLDAWRVSQLRRNECDYPTYFLERVTKTGVKMGVFGLPVNAQQIPRKPVAEMEVKFVDEHVLSALRDAYDDPQAKLKELRGQLSNANDRVRMYAERGDRLREENARLERRVKELVESVQTCQARIATFSRSNDELIEEKRQLAERLKTAESRLVESERLNTSLADRIVAEQTEGYVLAAAWRKDEKEYEAQIAALEQETNELREKLNGRDEGVHA